MNRSSNYEMAGGFGVNRGRGRRFPCPRDQDTRMPSHNPPHKNEIPRPTMHNIPRPRLPRQHQYVPFTSAPRTLLPNPNNPDQRPRFKRDELGPTLPVPHGGYQQRPEIPYHTQNPCTMNNSNNNSWANMRPQRGFQPQKQPLLPPPDETRRQAWNDGLNKHPPDPLRRRQGVYEEDHVGLPPPNPSRRSATPLIGKHNEESSRLPPPLLSDTPPSEDMYDPSHPLNDDDDNLQSQELTDYNHRTVSVRAQNQRGERGDNTDYNDQRPDLKRSKGPIEYDHGNVICKNHRSPPEDEFVHVESDGDNHPPQPRKPRPAQPGTEATNGTVVNYYHSKPQKLNNWTGDDEFTSQNYSNFDMNAGPVADDGYYSHPPQRSQFSSYLQPNNRPDNDISVVERDIQPYNELGSMNPLQLINEKYPGLEWEMVTQGSVHKAAYTAMITVQGTQYCGIGGSKKEAKKNCAQNAVEGLRLDESQTPRAPVNLRGGAVSKSIQPQTTRPKPETNRPHPLAERPHPLADMSVVVNPVAIKESNLIRRARKMRELGESSYLKSDRAKTCVQLIYEKCVGQQIEFDCIGHESIDNRLYFNMQCSINGTRFYGTSMDKKSAKQLAAKQALEDLFNWIPPPKE